MTAARHTCRREMAGTNPLDTLPPSHRRCAELRERHNQYKFRLKTRDALDYSVEDALECFDCHCRENGGVFGEMSRVCPQFRESYDKKKASALVMATENGVWHMGKTGMAPTHLFLCVINIQYSAFSRCNSSHTFLLLFRLHQSLK